MEYEVGKNFEEIAFRLERLEKEIFGEDEEKDNTQNDEVIEEL